MALDEYHIFFDALIRYSHIPWTAENVPML